jgi:hypothetical protein
VGLGLRLLSGLASGRTSERYHRHDQARADFEAAWRVFLSNRTEADFQASRDARDWTAWKYAMWERGERLPSQNPNSMMTCPCGEFFDSHDPEGSYVHRRHIYAAKATDGIRR